MVLMVREVTETERELTPEESALDLAICNADLFTFDLHEEIVDIFKNRLDNEIGFVGYVKPFTHGPSGVLYIGRFKKTVERPATDNERLAYYYVKMFKTMICRMDCSKCLFQGDCISYPVKYEECVKIIANKEFYEVPDDV